MVMARTSTERSRGQVAVFAFVVLVGLSTSGCGDDTESSDAGPVDAGEIDCEDACGDFLVIEHVTDLGQ